MNRIFGFLAVMAVLVGSAQVTQAQTKDIVSTAVEAGSFKTLAAALKAAGLVETLQSAGPFTVFAPTDEAFAKLPEGTVETLLKPENKDMLVGILTYHVVAGKVKAAQVVDLNGATTVNGQRAKIKVEGGNVMVDAATVVKTDIECTNGVIHVIDSVILPSDKSIPTIATEAGVFKTLLAAAKAAGLVDALSGKGPLTVLAPTDEAFGKLPKETIASLLKPENKGQLAAILKYHVIPGRNFADDILNKRSVKTLQGQDLKVVIKNQIPMINNSKLVAVDVNASNGVVHIIDTVLLPPMKKVSARMSPAAAKQLVLDTITQGCDLYNSGDHSGCSTLYEGTIRKLISQTNGMPNHVMTSLNSSLKNIQHTSSQTDRAWILRSGLDTAYNGLSH